MLNWLLIRYNHSLYSLRTESWVGKVMLTLFKDDD